MAYLFHLYRHIEYPSYVAVAVMEMNFERIDINQCPLGTLQHILYEEGLIQRRMQRSSLLLGGQK